MTYEPTPERFDALAAARAGVRRTWAFLTLLSLVFLIGSALAISEGDVLVGGLMFSMWAGGVGGWSAYQVWCAYRSWQRRRLRSAYEFATRKAGMSLESVEVTRAARIRHAARGSMEPFLAALVPGALLSGAAMTWGNFMPGLTFGLSWLAIIASGAGVLALRDAFREDDESLHSARAEVAYREVARAGVDLGGALSIGVASTSGGDLSVSAEVGGLDAVEEVVMDFDSTEAQCEGAEVCMRKCDGQG